MYTLTAERLIQAPADVVWVVIADVERYADYAPNLSRAYKTSQGEKPSRRCYDLKGRGWNETCTLWQEGEVYRYQVDTSDYPYPFSFVQGTWGLRPSAEGTIVYMQFDYQPRPQWMQWITHQAVKRSFKPIVVQLMDNWEQAILQSYRSA
jgi:ribosome-associated toxin RatA of RatAB toxin-antitoxin module